MTSRNVTKIHVHKQALQMQIQNINFIFFWLLYFEAEYVYCKYKYKKHFDCTCLLLIMNQLDAGHCWLSEKGGGGKYFSSIHKKLPQYHLFLRKKSNSQHFQDKITIVLLLVPYDA